MGAIDIRREARSPSVFSPLESISRDLDRFFMNMERMTGPIRTWTGNEAEFIPACDIDETENAYHMSMEIPGLDKDDIQIEVVGDSVRISGEKRHEKEVKGKNQYRVERSWGKFSRSFTLPQGVREDGIEANYHAGVLDLNLPKQEKSKAKKIAVKCT